MLGNDVCQIVNNVRETHQSVDVMLISFNQHIISSFLLCTVVTMHLLVLAAHWL